MTKDLANVEEGEIVESPPAALSGPQAVMLTPAQLKKQMQRDTDMRAIINDYINKNMVAGKDYGTIEVKGTTSKPSLFKPGSEKFCGLFKIRATFRKDQETAEMLGNTPGIIAYICDLVDSRGRVVGEGRGVYKVSTTDSDFNINKAVKIAEKRAQIDAVLRTGGLSDFFTQDMEDLPMAQRTSTPAASGSAPQPQQTTSAKPVSAAQQNLIDKLLDQKILPGERESLVLPKTVAEASDFIKKLMAMPNVGV